MQITETNTDGLKHEFKVVIAAADIEQRVTTRLAEIGRKVRLPGFRPGKVPMTVLKKRYGPAVMGEVLERAVNDSSTEALREPQPAAGAAAQGRDRLLQRGHRPRIQARGRGAAGDPADGFRRAHAGAPAAGSAGGRDRGGARAHRQAAAQERGRRARGGEGRRRRHRFQGLGRRQGIPRRRRRGLHARARLRQLHSRLRGSGGRR